MPILFLIAIGALVLISNRASASSREAHIDYDPADPVGSWGKAMDTYGKQYGGSTHTSTSSSDSTWIDLYKHYKGQGAVIGAPPPEMPKRTSDVGPVGDLASMNSSQEIVVIAALYEENDPAKLFMLADAAEIEGFPIAANRLREKALRVIGGG